MSSRSFLSGATKARIQQALRRGVASAFEPGGDLGGDATEQQVVAIDGVPTPDAGSASPGSVMVVENDFPAAPRSLLMDGTTLWAAASTQIVPPPTPSPEVYRYTADGDDLTVDAKIDLAAILPAVQQVRQIAQDADYIYAATWDAENVAIIDKSTTQVVGWGFVAGERIVSLCTDGAGNIFVHALDTGPFTSTIRRFSVSACLGQAPNTVGPNATLVMPNNIRRLAYHNGSLYVTDGGFGGGLQQVDPTGAMSIVGSNPALSCHDLVVAFGSLWVTEYSGSDVWRVNLTTLAVDATVATGATDVNGIGTGPDAAYTADAWIWVTDISGSQIFAIDPGTDAQVDAVGVTGLSEGVAGGATRVYTGAFLAPNTAIDSTDPATSTSVVAQSPHIIYATRPSGYLIGGVRGPLVIGARTAGPTFQDEGVQGALPVPMPFVILRDGFLRMFHARLAGGPGVGQTVDVGIRVGSGGVADLTLPSLTGVLVVEVTDSTSVIPVQAGQTVDLFVTASGGAPQNLIVSMEFHAKP
jgi:hypothetical protein